MSRLIRYLVLGVIAAVSVTSLLRRRVERPSRPQVPELTGKQSSPLGRSRTIANDLQSERSESLPAKRKPDEHHYSVPIPSRGFDRSSGERTAISAMIAPILVLIGVVATLATGWLAYVPVGRPQASVQASPMVQASPIVQAAPGDTRRAPNPVPTAELKKDARVPVQTSMPIGGSDDGSPEAGARPDGPAETEGIDLGVLPGSLPSSKGYVLSFDGTADSAVVDWGTKRSLSTRDEWTFEVWLRPATLTGPQSVYVESISVGIGSRVVELGIGLNDRNIVVGRRQPAIASMARWKWTTAPLPAEVSPGTWFHLETTSKSGEVGIWIDGTRVLGVDSQTSGPPVLDGSPISIAGIGVTSAPLLTAPFGGAIDEVRFWDGASASPESGRGRADRISRSDASLIGYFPISASDAVGVGVPDVTGNLAPLRFEGGLRWAALAPGSGDEPPPNGVVGPSLSVASQVGEVATGAEGAWIVQNAFVGDGPSVGWKIGGDASRSEGGWLRLTRAVSMQLGWAYFEEALPTAPGLTIDFDYAAWTENDLGADGIVVFLADALSPAVELGQRAGSLGYGRYCQTGLSNAYLGVALDSFGTFSSNEPTCNAGAGSRSPNSVVVRGSGNRNQGYWLITNQVVPVSFVATGAGARPQLGATGTQHVTLTLSGDGFLSLAVSYYGTRDPVTAITRFYVGGVPGQAALPDAVRIGVTGATGGLSAVNEVSRISVRIGK